MKEPSNAPKDFPEGEHTDTSEDRQEWLIENIAILSKHTRSIYLLYLGFLTYCIVTVVSTSDRQIILDEAVSLPIIGVEVPMTGFFILAPILAISIFIYFQLYLQELKELRDKLCTVYPNVEQERLYPWMFNIADRHESGFVSRLQKWSVSLGMWWMLPSVLFLFAFWFITKHDPFLSYILGLMPAVGIITVVFFWHKYTGRELDTPRMWLTRLAIPETIFDQVLTAAAIFELFILFFLIPYSLSGASWAITADLSHEILITEQKESYKTYWVDFEGIRLEGANLTGAVLQNANFRKAHLQHAKLKRTQLKGSNLIGAKLQNADFSKANLQNTDLFRTILQNTVLINANLQGANLSEAQLQGADLRYAQLQGADLSRAHLQGADIRYAQLQDAALHSAQLKEVNLLSARLQDADLSRTHLQDADLSMARLNGANISYAQLQDAVLSNSHLQDVYLFNANLQGANLSKAQLQGADLRFAQLQGADLSDARLQNAVLSNAQLKNAVFSKAKDLAINQLCVAKSLYQAVELEPSLKEAVNEHCPELINKPYKKPGPTINGSMLKVVD